ncbi:hypothetical protein K9M50_00120 [Patescibacteria group bacterium]|nr:hypothetical protein [Patescibacteria group bacterium]
MKTKILFLAILTVFFAVNVQAQSQHTLRNQFDKNVLVEIPSNGIREYLGPINSSSNTSSHLFYGSTVKMKITVDYKEPVEVLVNLGGEYIDINQDLLDQADSSSSEIDIVEEDDYQSSSDNSKSVSSAKEVLFINTTDYKMVGKTGAVKGLTLMPGDTIDNAIIRLNKVLRYNLFEGNYIDNNNTVLEKDNADKLLALYNSSAKIKWLNPGVYEENFKVFLSKSGERDNIGALLILQFKVDDKTGHVIIDEEEVSRNLPHGEKIPRDIINKSYKKIQLTIGGTQKVISSAEGRRFSKLEMAEKLANGYYYITVSLITNKAIQRDLLLLIDENQRHFVIEQDDVDKIINSDYQGQGL